MSTGWVWDEAYAWHQTGAGAAFLPAGGWIEPGLLNFETSASKTRLRNLAARSGLLDLMIPLGARDATRDELLRLHSEDYLSHVKAVSDSGGGEAGEATPIGPGSYEIAVRAAGGALTAVEAVVGGQVNNAYALVRPPGHHAEASRARGYCLFGNSALAALHARRALGLRRVAIVDWDVHHGNGTEDAFYDDPSVLTISMHADDLYPLGRGRAEDNGRDAGLGSNINIPLPDGSGHGAYMAVIDQVVVPALRKFRPELVVVASGYDACSLDPLGRQLLVSETYRAMTQTLLGFVEVACDGRIVVIHEGGYSEAYVPFCGAAVIETLLGVNVVEDPFLPYLAGRRGQSLQPHQEAVISGSRDLLEHIPVPVASEDDACLPS